MSEAIESSSRVEGGTRLGGRVLGRSFPASFLWMRCMATANSFEFSFPLFCVSDKFLYNHKFVRL
jgi:hypothetical protein